MKKIALTFTALVAFVFMSADIKYDGYKVGDKATDFSLKNVDGEFVSMADGADNNGYIIVFTCNTCPWARGYEQRIIDLHNEFASKGYPVIAIQPNDPGVQPGDSYEEMQKRAKKYEYPFPYLMDEGQEMAIAYGATATPHVFLVEKESDGYYVRYTGTIDDNPRDGSKVSERYVEAAIGSLLAGSDVEVKSTKAFGCTIKWSASNKERLGKS